MSKITPIVQAYEALLARGRLQPNPAQAALVNQLGRLQHRLLEKSILTLSTYDHSHNNGLYIFGGVGTGKSRIADLFASTLPRTITSKRIHFHEFMVDVHTRLHHARSQSDYRGDPLVKIGQQICFQSPVLCFDEFQVSDIADAMILKRLFASFWGAGGIMVSTSNRHPTELYLNGLNRPLFVPFIKELQERCLVWRMEGEHDYRLDTRQEDRVPVFFTNRKAFYDSLGNATNHQHLEQVEIKVVMNRSITVNVSPTNIQSEASTQKPSNMVAHATFSTLCKDSRGSSDYHALCKFAQTIYVSGLQQFASSDLDFVRRFITLIDIAYESRTRIICFSETSLSELFKNVGVSVEPVGSEGSNESTNKANSRGHHNTAHQDLTVRKEGGSSSSMMSTFIGEVEWSATGLVKASLATGGAGETDVRFAIGRAISRLSEMGSVTYGAPDNTS